MVECVLLSEHQYWNDASCEDTTTIEPERRRRLSWIEDGVFDDMEMVKLELEPFHETEVCEEMDVYLDLLVDEVDVARSQRALGPVVYEDYT